jgi:hypothetical protein
MKPKITAIIAITWLLATGCTKDFEFDLYGGLDMGSGGFGYPNNVIDTMRLTVLEYPNNHAVPYAYVQVFSGLNSSDTVTPVITGSADVNGQIMFLGSGYSNGYANTIKTTRDDYWPAFAVDSFSSNNPNKSTIIHLVPYAFLRLHIVNTAPGTINGVDLLYSNEPDPMPETLRSDLRNFHFSGTDTTFTIPAFGEMNNHIILRRQQDNSIVNVYEGRHSMAKNETIQLEVTLP